MENLVTFLLGHRSPEEVIADVSQRIRADAATNSVKVNEVIHGRGFVYGRVSPVDEANFRRFGKIH